MEINNNLRNQIQSPINLNTQNQAQQEAYNQLLYLEELLNNFYSDHGNYQDLIYLVSCIKKLEVDLQKAGKNPKTNAYSKALNYLLKNMKLPDGESLGELLQHGATSSQINEFLKEYASYYQHDPDVRNEFVSILAQIEIAISTS